MSNNIEKKNRKGNIEIYQIKQALLVFVSIMHIYIYSLIISLTYRTVEELVKDWLGLYK